MLFEGQGLVHSQLASTAQLVEAHKKLKLQSKGMEAQLAQAQAQSAADKDTQEAAALQLADLTARIAQLEEQQTANHRSGPGPSGFCH